MSNDERKRILSGESTPICPPFSGSYCDVCPPGLCNRPPTNDYPGYGLHNGRPDLSPVPKRVTQPAAEQVKHTFTFRRHHLTIMAQSFPNMCVRILDPLTHRVLLETSESGELHCPMCGFTSNTSSDEESSDDMLTPRVPCHHLNELKLRAEETTEVVYTGLKSDDMYIRRAEPLNEVPDSEMYNVD